MVRSEDSYRPVMSDKLYEEVSTLGKRLRESRSGMEVYVRRQIGLPQPVRLIKLGYR